MTAYLFLLPLFCVTGAAQTQNRECVNFKTLPRDSERSKDNSILPTNQRPCDDVSDGWYRFKTGEIATSCVPDNHCGTTSTIWMNDPVPKIGETLVNNFCVNHKTWSSQDNCCLFSFKVNVTNCDGYLVYYFQRDSLLCPSGYCTGDLKPCLPGSTSPTGFEPCVASYPGMDSPPTLHPPVITNTGKDFSQICEIHYRGSDPDAAFLVMWLFEGSIHKMVTLTNGTTSTSLTSADWKGHVGQKLTCIVESYFASSGKSNHSHLLKSNEFFGGLQVIPDTQTIHEGYPNTITIFSTLPLVCSNLSPDKCMLDIDTVISGINQGDLVISGACSVSLKASDWDPATHKVQVTTQLSTLIDPVIKADKTYKINFNIQHYSSDLDFFNTKGHLELNVATKDAPHHMCIVVGESEVIGFHQPKSFMMGSTAGDTLMYRGPDPNGKILQVQIRSMGPIGYFPVVCAAAFQYGDTVVKVDMCSNDHDLAAPAVTQGGGSEGDVQIYLCDTEYEIVTDNGVRLTVIPRYLHLDIKIHLPPGYDPSSEGVCGHIATNVLRLSQTEMSLYSVQKNDNLFEKAGPPFSSAINTVAKSSPKHCLCGRLASTCDQFRRVQDPMAPYSFSTNGLKSTKSRCDLFVPHGLDADYGDFVNKPPVSLTRPVLQPIIHSSRPYQTAAMIQDQCLADSKMYMNHYCLLKYFNETKDYVRICSYDERSAGSKQFHISAIQAFQWLCEEQALISESTYTKDNNGIPIPPPELTSDVCPNFCSLNGTCLHGTCSCHDVALGPDCFVSTLDPDPVILAVKGNFTLETTGCYFRWSGQYCKKSSNHCSDPILVTRNVYPSDKLQAVITPIELVNGNFQNTTSAYHIHPVYESHYSVSLRLTNTSVISLKDQAAFGLLITLTADGKRFSNPYKYIVYDDKCQVCQNEVCYPKPNTCHIGGKCYIAGEVNPILPSEVCDAARGIIHWSPVTNGGQNPAVVGRK